MSRWNTVARILPFMVAACARQHPGPEGADTVTNWLAACERDSDCRGEAICLNAVCSVACSTPSAAGCAALHDDAICDLATNACDVPCAGSSACKSLGSAYACQEGRCRVPTEAEPSESSARPPRSSVPLTWQFAEPMRDATWSEDQVSEARHATFAPGAKVQLNEGSSQLDVPRVTWQGDHFRVVWSVDPYTMPGTRLELASVYPEGRLDAQRLTITTSNTMNTYKGNGSSVAHVAVNAVSCSVSVTDLDSARSSEPWKFDCMSSASAAPVPDSEDWLIAWTGPSGAVEGELGLIVGRFDPRLFGWSAGPWQVASYPANSAAFLAAAGGDVWAWEGNSFGDELHRAHALAQPAGSERAERVTTFALTASSELPSSDELRRLDFAAGETIADASHRSVVPVTGGVLVIESIAKVLESAGERVLSRELRTTAIDDDGSQHEPHYLPITGDAIAARLRDQQLIALCLVDEGLSLQLIDENGLALGESIRVQSNSVADDFTMMNVVGCDLAWSGAELLVVWNEKQFYNGSRLPGNPAPWQFNNIQAQSFSLSDLTSR